MRRAALLWVLFPVAALACKCQMTMSVCNEVAATDIIFVGTVEAIEPSFLDSWNAGQRAALDLLNQESARAQTDHSPAAFAKLRDAYLKIFPDLPPDHKKRLAEATSPEQLAELFYWILDHGKRVRLRVKTVFRGEIGDDETMTTRPPKPSKSGPRSAIAASISRPAKPTSSMPTTTRSPTS